MPPQSCHTSYILFLILHHGWSFCPDTILFIYISDAEAEPTHLVFPEAYRLDNITESQNVLYLVHSLLRDLGDVYQSFFARRKLEERAEIFDADDLSFKYLSGLKVRYDGMDEFGRLVHALLSQYRR